MTTETGKPMRIFCAQLATETNTFAAAPTGWSGFEAHGIYHGDASLKAPNGTGALMHVLREWIAADGHQMVESLCAFAEPSGPTLKAVYEAMREEILADLRQALPVDAVLLVLHGAMVADGYDDCEGDLLEQVRAIVGPGVPIGAELDLHCHFTECMRQHADLLLAYKEYPHTDLVERCRELYELLLRTARGEVRPRTAVFDCRMVGLWHTTPEPMRGFVQRMQALEGKNGVLSVSLGHGFPWGDVPESGAKLWVITDGDAQQAWALAQFLGQEFWSLREATRVPTLTIDEALDAALQADAGPVVLADVADNAGGGAPGDSTFILCRMLERGIGRAASGVYFDPGAVQVCSEAGVGASLALRIGGKQGPASGDPLDLQVTVRGIEYEHSQAMFGMRAPLGTAAWVEVIDSSAGDLHLILVSLRSQVFSPDAFTGLGLDALGKRIVVLKSTQHFHAAFAPLASQVLYVSTPGAITPNFAAIAYRRRSLHYWPRVAEPHETAP